MGSSLLNHTARTHFKDTFMHSNDVYGNTSESFKEEAEEEFKSDSKKNHALNKPKRARAMTYRTQPLSIWNTTLFTPSRQPWNQAVKYKSGMKQWLLNEKFAENRAEKHPSPKEINKTLENNQFLCVYDVRVEKGWKFRISGRQSSTLDYAIPKEMMPEPKDCNLGWNMFTGCVRALRSRVRIKNQKSEKVCSPNTAPSKSRQINSSEWEVKSNRISVKKARVNIRGRKCWIT